MNAGFGRMESRAIRLSTFYERKRAPSWRPATASLQLRNFSGIADIAVTAAHYADKKTRTVIDMGALLGAGDSGPPGNVIAMLSKSTLPESTTKARRK